MRAVGVICEYNPFHNGHKHQIEAAKKLSGCDALVCVMSGSVVQRGEVALKSKWERAKTALQNGADLVIELPAYYVLQSAKEFALGGINILYKSHLVDSISFGSESGEAENIIKCAEIMSDKNEELKPHIDKLMKEGASYPLSIRSAVEKVYPQYAHILNNPNDMLGVSYASAILELGADFKMFPVKRLGADHGSEALDGITASSTAIREALKKGEDISNLIPYEFGGETYSAKNLEAFILGFYRTVSPKILKEIPGMEPGFENKLISASKEAKTLDEFYDLLVSKRYTKSRVMRTSLAGIIGMKKGMECDYIRILGFTDKGAELLKSAKDKTELPFVTKTADFSPSEKSTFLYDILSTDIAALSCNNENLRGAGADFYNSPVKI